MSKTTAMADLLAGYRAYSTSGDLRISPIGEAPATTPVCVSAIASATAGGSLAATAEVTC